MQGVIGCILVCTVLIGLGEANRRKQIKLNEAHTELERRVEERTAQLSEALATLESEAKVRREGEEQLRRLSLRLMMIQDEERRRIARNLHDAAGQTLAAIKMTVASLQQVGANRPDVLRLLDDLAALSDEALHEIRTMSFLLHPPLLDEAGLGSAVRWFVDGFSKRSGIQVGCEIPEKLERLPKNIELVLFRVLQESLTNVHRHSGASAASVRLIRDASGIKFQVSDNGRGLAEEHQKHSDETKGIMGVGITGMRERVRELGGQLTVESSAAGTTIAVAVPGPGAWFTITAG
jgi:signal transduction histidine kinase